MKASAKAVMNLGVELPNCYNSAPWGYWEDTFQIMCEEMELSKAPAVNAAIDDLDPIEQMAIHHKHLYAVFKFHRHDLEDIYQKGRDRLAVVLPQRGIY